MNHEQISHDIDIRLDSLTLPGILSLPGETRGLVIFAHGSGSSRLSSRNTFVARVLQKSGIGTLLFDLLTEEEDLVYENRFDIDLITRRLVETTRWLGRQPETRGLSYGYFGASTGAAAALKAAAQLGAAVKAVVSRGGRPDLAGEALPQVRVPTLLIVGGNDEVVISLNQQALEQLDCLKKLEIVPGATHLFEEPGTLEQVAELAARWFSQYLSTS
jgi:putative phosphoribosyl transferase